MVTRSQVGKLASRIDDLTSALGVDQAIKVTVFYGETEAFAMERHRTLRPEHAGRRVRFEYVDGERSAVFAEEVAVWTATAEEAAAFEAGFQQDDGRDRREDAKQFALAANHPRGGGRGKGLFREVQTTAQRVICERTTIGGSPDSVRFAGSGRVDGCDRWGWPCGRDKAAALAESGGITDRGRNGAGHSSARFLAVPLKRTIRPLPVSSCPRELSIRPGTRSPWPLGADGGNALRVDDAHVAGYAAAATAGSRFEGYGGKGCAWHAHARETPFTRIF